MTLKSEASYYGPSYMINDLWQDYHGITIETVLINCHYPVTADSFVLQWGVSVKRLPGLDKEKADKVAGKLAKSFGVGFLQDVEIWRNKTRIDNPLLCEEDGPVYQLRRWYEQFYVDVEDVTEEMTQPLRVRGRHHAGPTRRGSGRSRRTWPAGRPSVTSCSD